MCGIAGYLSDKPLGGGAAAVLTAMTDAIRHRGPDDAGQWYDAEAGAALGHRRLSILDLTPSGHQPMESACGRFVLTYNGEIYNFADLRRELEEARAAPNWRGHSDTEILLAGIAHWGLAEALRRASGMFALALWDRRERTLTLARDRMGEKPLYYGRMNGAQLFGSELKALTAFPGFKAEIDRGAIVQHLRHNYIPAPRSIWQGIRKLPPGTYAVLKPGTEPGEPIPYWSFDEVARAGLADPLPAGAALVDELDRLLRKVVGRMMIADVPLGAFLSGGIDSSTIVAIMQAQAARPVRTFSIGFPEAEFDESAHARAVAAHLGTDHTELHVTGQDALDTVPRLAAIWDEPFADSSQVPTLLLSELTRSHVTVSLSGDAGDELFGGYRRYWDGVRIWNRVSRAPWAARRAAAAVARWRLTRAVLRAADAVGPLAFKRLALYDRLPKAADLFVAQEPMAYYRGVVSHVRDPANFVVGAVEPPPAFALAPGLPSFEEAMMHADSMTYLPDDILVKVDRAAMSASLETRVPFLDHELIAFAWRLPLSERIEGGRGKLLLRRVLDRYVPRSIIERPKMGFGVPLASWLRGPLRDWAAALLDPARLKSEGYLAPAPVARMWREHQRGIRNWHNQLWDVLMFQAWLERNAGFVGVPA